MHLYVQNITRIGALRRAARTAGEAMTRADGVADAELKSEILRSLQRRDWAVSICPQQIARSLTGDKTWRTLLPRIRCLLAQLVREQRVVVTRGTEVLGAQDLEGGSIRIRRGPQFE
jgi:hypothetical protein